MIQLYSYVVVHSEADEDEESTCCYLARIERMKKCGDRQATQYKNAVKLGGNKKEGPEAGYTPLFPVDVTADSGGAKNLFVQLVWLNHVDVKGSSGVFKLGGNGGDHEWYEAHLIRGTVHMRNYDGKAKIISAQPTPSNGWSTYFSIEPEIKDDIMDLLGHGKKRLSKKGKKKKTRKAKVAQVAKAKADKAKAAKAKPTLTRTTSAPPARKAPKNGKTPIRRSNTLGGNKNVGKGRARTLHKCMLQPPNRRPNRCPQSEAHDTFVQALGLGLGLSRNLK